MPGIDEGRTEPCRKLDRPAVHGAAAESIEAAERVNDRIERLACFLCALASPGALAISCIFLLQMRRIEHHEPRKLARRGGCDHLALESLLGE